MSKKVATLCSVVALVAAVGSAEAVQATTKPGVVYIVRVRVTDHAISFPARDHAMPRNATIRYSIYNAGSKPYAFQVWETRTDPIKPRRRDSVFVGWYNRGRYTYQTLYRGRATGVRGYITVF